MQLAVILQDSDHHKLATDLDLRLLVNAPVAGAYRFGQFSSAHKPGPWPADQGRLALRQGRGSSFVTLPLMYVNGGVTFSVSRRELTKAVRARYWRVNKKTKI